MSTIQKRSLLLASLFVVSCGQNKKAEIQSLVAFVPQGIECVDGSHQSIFQNMIDFDLDQAKKLDYGSRFRMPRDWQLNELRKVLSQRLYSKSRSIDDEKKSLWVNKMADIIVLLDRDLRALDSDEYENQIARIDYKSQITPQYAQLSAKVHQLINETQSLSQDLGIQCDYPQQIQSQNEPTEGPDSLFAGLRWTMATAYQGCDVLKLEPVNSRTEDVQGIRKKSDWGREYADLNLIHQTHYYLKGRSYQSDCLDVSQKPLIYDYGGSARIKSGQLDLFTNYNAGSALGVDCSAFASVGAATAGLLYVKGSAKRPIYSRWSTRDFVDPESSGWTCYSKVRVSPTGSIRSGDLATIKGSHMVGIDTLGVDPFGIESVIDFKECDRLSADNFQFTIIQSASTKGSMGINRFKAADYVKEAPELERLFLGYARAACLAKFTKRTFLPEVGNAVSIIRHAGTDECKAKRVPLLNEKCIQSCGI